jgi:threonine dehydratase
MRLIYERMKMVVEPSAAVPLAALLKHKAMFEGKKVGVIVSGGNVDIAKLSGLLKK